MSTKIEELSDTEDFLENDVENSYETDCDETVEVEKFENIEPKETGVQEETDITYRIIKMLIEKIKHPVMVSIIFLILTHPLLIQGIFNIQYIQVVDNTISVNVILSILAGIIFFLLREIV
jgi:hypothetical protein